LTISGTFKVLAVLAVLARFLQYIPTCLAVLVLRRRDEPPGYRIPLGPVVPLLALIVCMWLLLDAGTESAAIGGLELPTLAWGGLAALLGVPFYFLSRRTAATPAT
jgi:amino acid transporter